MYDTGTPYQFYLPMHGTNQNAVRGEIVASSSKMPWTGSLWPCQPGDRGPATLLSVSKGGFPGTNAKVQIVREDDE